MNDYSWVDYTIIGIMITVAILIPIAAMLASNIFLGPYNEESKKQKIN